MGQSRERSRARADRHAVWLDAHGLEPKMSPFDPMGFWMNSGSCRGYEVRGMNLLAGQRSAHDSGRIAQARKAPENPADCCAMLFFGLCASDQSRV